MEKATDNDFKIHLLRKRLNGSFLPTVGPSKVKTM